MTKDLERKFIECTHRNQQDYLEYLYKFYSGIQNFQRYPYTPHKIDNKILWQEESTQLIDFGLPDKLYDSIVLFIPSFINKSYILDITKDRSLLKYCANCSYRPVLLDWGNPHHNEVNYNFESYLNERILPVLRLLWDISSKIVIAGYCLGGLSAIAAAQLMPRVISGLVLLATPWNFSHFQEKSKTLENSINLLLSSNSMVHSTHLRYFFHSLAPHSKIYDKFIEFTRYMEDTQKAELFVAVERWAMDDMNIARGVFHECYYDFIIDNKAFNNQWIINGQIIDPTKIKIKSLIVIPAKDHIVPYDSVAPIIKLLDNNTVILPESGHVGMIIGEKAETQLWQPMISWLESL